jgi:predicted deacylase
MEHGIPAITVEIGNPQRFQERFIQFALLGVENILCSLEMVPREPHKPNYEPVVCSGSFWIFTTAGGILEVLPDINNFIREQQLIARIYNVFGDEIEEYYAPADGIVVGKSTNPVCQTGDRILHLGVFGKTFMTVSEDGHL